MKPINVLMATGAVTKPVTHAINFQQPVRIANPYVQFGYTPLKIFNHNQGQVSGSINTDTINMIHITQQPKKYGLN